MGQIITYNIGVSTSACAIKLDSGDRVSVEVVDTAWPKIQVTRMSFSPFGRQILWSYSKDQAGDHFAYRANLKEMFPPTGKSETPIEVITEILMKCRTLQEAKEQLVARERLLERREAA